MPKKIKTRERILSKALEMFNQRGIEYVGLRELARELNIRVGNITYYFPAKDDLVNGLSLELRDLNAAVFYADKNITPAGFITMISEVFGHHIRYRCLLLSFVHLIEQNSSMADRYKSTEQSRNQTLQKNISYLGKNGYLHLENEEEERFLVSNLALIIRFWVSESQISYKHWTETERIQHYRELILRLLLAHARVESKSQIMALIRQNTN